MPANDHLNWVEIREFGSLYTGNKKFLMPGNGAQIMQNCSPVPGGGLRAFYRRQMLSGSTAPNLTGLDLTNDLFLGSFSHPAGGINPTAERYLVSWRKTDRLVRVFYSTGGAWTAILTTTATSATPTLRQSFFETYLDAGTRRVVFNINCGVAADGVYIVTGGGAPTKLTIPGTPGGPISVFQSRIVVSDGSLIRFSDVGNTTFGANNWVNVEPSGLRPNTVFMVGFEPSDLLIGKEAGPLILVQGDLTNPTVRAMDETVTVAASQQPGPMPGGLAFMAHRDGVFVTGHGSTPQRISDPLDPNNFGLPPVFGTYTPSWMGNIVYSNGYLFTPAAIYDVRSRAWFTSQAEPGNNLAPLYVYDRTT